MAKVFIQEETLTAIGDAIREKTSTTAKLSPTVMPSYIRNIVSGGGGGYEPTSAELTYTGDMTMAFASDKFNWVIENYGNKVVMNDCYPLTKMFYNSYRLTRIPFTIKYSNATGNHDVSEMFNECNSLMEVPAIAQWRPTKMQKLFNNCYSIREVPDSFVNAINWSDFEAVTSQYNAQAQSMFQGCKSLRKFPIGMIHFANCSVSTTYHPYNNMCGSCATLDEVVNIPVDKNSIKSDIMWSMFYNCHRVKNITFAPYDGTVAWTNQQLYLGSGVGYCNGNISDRITGYNSGISSNKQVTPDTYQELKDDPDWFSTTSGYSRYDKQSAINTINSLPTTTGTGCTITFEGNNGFYTVNGAINTLTEEQIAVATAKGWTVSFT